MREVPLYRRGTSKRGCLQEEGRLALWNGDGGQRAVGVFYLRKLVHLLVHDSGSGSLEHLLLSRHPSRSQSTLGL